MLIEVGCSQENCPVFNKCCFLPTTFFPIENKVDILFVGQGGGSEEREKGRPFIGKAGKRLKTIILQVKEEIGKPFGVAFSNTIRDNPDNNRVPIDEEILLCRKFLFRDINRLKKKWGLTVIMPLGNHAKSLFIENKLGITTDRKNIYTIRNNDFGSIIVKPSLHPSYIMRHGNYQNKFDRDLIDDIKESILRANL